MSVDTFVERPLPGSLLRPEVASALLALADDELVIGHRHSQWLGLSPFLEEDLTMASIAQDEMGHARSLYACIWPDWADREADVVRRPASEWRSCQLVELAAPTWEWALIRHWIYDTLEPLRWLSIESSFGSEIEGFGALLAKAAQEERFHRQHAEQLVVKLGLANPEANARLQRGVDSVMPLIATLVEPDQLESAWELLRVVAEKANLLLPSALRSTDTDSDSDSGSALASGSADSALASAVFMPGSGSAGRVIRHADFAEVHAALLAVVSVDPIATW